MGQQNDFIFLSMVATNIRKTHASFKNIKKKISVACLYV